jgi:hypothetical protein
MRRRGSALALACALPSLGLAHGIDHPRTLALDLSASPARLALVLTIPRAVSASTRRLFDRDRDGSLSAAERGPLTRYLEAKAWGGLRFRCDGTEVVPAPARTNVAGTDDAKELQLRLETTVPLVDGRCELEDGGDTTGHLPVRITGGEATLDAPRKGDVWNVPAHRPARLTGRR